ncbi:hypothetical protein ACIQTT_16385 [Microbacterium sp. NPDC090225]|uniref:hypothetical protein n=1 Tax=Microbacterium sp. NPDC090225 TaxID=3364207 RepID=UPI00382CF5BB
MSDKENKPTCFVISPIGAEDSDVRKAADQALRHVITKALGDEFNVVRGDQDANPGSITAQIIQSILKADLVVADLSGFNPNVYYEVAVAHGYNRPTVHIQRAGEKPAFDLQDMRLIQYDIQDPDNIEKAQSALKEFVAFLMATPDEAKTPLAHANRFLTIADSMDPVAQSNSEVIDQLRSLRSEVLKALPNVSGGTSQASRAAHVVSLRKVIERAASRGALIASDFAGVITSKTNEKFDDWARRRLSEILDETDSWELNQTLFDGELLQMLHAEDPV